MRLSEAVITDTTVRLHEEEKWCDLPSKILRTNLHRWFETERSWSSEIFSRIIEDGNVSKRNITIHSDSQIAIRALNSNVMNSKIVYGCRRYLNKIAERYDSNIIWVLGHSDILGNCRADKLASWATTIELS